MLKKRVIHKGSNLFKTEDIVCKSGYEERYDSLLKENKLLFTLDIIKEKLTLAYSRKDECLMAEDIISIIDMCKATGNTHLLWFERLLNNHFEGIIAHPTYDISAEKKKASTIKSRLSAGRGMDIRMASTSS